MRVKVVIVGSITLPDNEQGFRDGYGPNIGLFQTEITNFIDRLSVEACQIIVENEGLEGLMEDFEVESISVTDDGWILDLDTMEDASGD